MAIRGVEPATIVRRAENLRKFPSCEHRHFNLATYVVLHFGQNDEHDLGLPNSFVSAY